MKKHLLLLVGMFCVALCAYSQNDHFYYANGTRHYWQEDKASVIIIGKSAVNYDSIASILRVLFDKPDEEVVTYRNSNRFIINSRSLETMSMDSLIGLISVMPDDIAYLSYAKIVGGNKIWLTNEAYVMLKDSVYYATYMQPILSRYQGVAVHPEGNNMYRLVCSTEEQVLSLANSLYDENHVFYSTPDFYSEMHFDTDDPFFPEQWNLKNTGQ